MSVTVSGSPVVLITFIFLTTILFTFLMHFVMENGRLDRKVDRMDDVNCELRHKLDTLEQQLSTINRVAGTTPQQQTSEKPTRKPSKKQIQTAVHDLQEISQELAEDTEDE